MKKHFNIFIAGSKEIREERDWVKVIISDYASEHKNLTFTVKTFENFPDYMNKHGQQTAYNAYIAKESDIVIFIFTTHVGDKTKEELDVAYKTYQEEQRPYILVFCDEIAIKSSENAMLQKIQNDLNALKQYYKEYKSRDDLRHEIRKNLDFIIQPKPEDEISRTVTKRVLICLTAITLLLLLGGGIYVNWLNMAKIETINYLNGDKYNGNVKNGLKHGKGIFLFDNGRRRYEGSFKNDKFNGQGTCYYANDTQYKGGWVDGLKHGYGEENFENGDYYKGNWKEDKPSGEGILYFDNARRRYEGSFANGKFHGHGMCYYANGTKYNGEWAHGLKNGFGEETFGNGECYKGYWKNDKQHGEGTYYWSNGNYERGMFIDGKPNGKFLYFFYGDTIPSLEKIYHNGQIINENKL